ncbi:MAG: DUF1501 domain-containing protein [Cocleimonas sp.]|nr:DUF1501 domain-containing protein [Cocleimonas sp.]
MDRRDFIKYSSLISAAGILPEWAFAAGRPQRQDKILVLVELKGGNDGFNTLVPHHDPLYEIYRKNIALLPRQTIPLRNSGGRALAPSLKAIAPLWNNRQMAWIEGVGYPDTVLSHFRSIDIWDTASNANEVLDNGWLSRLLPKYKKGLHGIAINPGQVDLGPLDGSSLNSVTMQNPLTFLRQARYIEDVELSRQTAALAHITNKQHQLYDVSKQINERIGKRGAARNVMRHVRGEVGHSLESVAEMIINGVDSPVYKVTQSGFDTHANQLGAHNNALFQLSEGLASFAEAMKRFKMWDNVLIVTYSEFGRRAKVNKSAGTDHGTASAHMVLGGKVRGGRIYGKHPDLSKLDENGNVRHTTDFRSIYATIGKKWLGQSTPWNKFGTIPFI